MRWTPGGESPDIEDRREQNGANLEPGRAGLGLGPLLGAFLGSRRLGLGGLLLLLLVGLFIQHFASGPSSPSLNRSPYGSANREAGNGGREDREVQFVSFVLDDAQQTWDDLLPKAGIPYRHAKLVLFRDYIASGCGEAQAATGPFYCPADEKVYLDLGFFDELANRLGA